MTQIIQKQSFYQYIDEDSSSRQSLLLRYHPVLTRMLPGVEVTKDALAASSSSEGARIFPLAQYRGVNIWACDESSLMATGTYKDLDACLMAAIARKTGLGSIVLSSGGNLGYAMARYARKAGLQVYFFHPKSTLYKLDAANFEGDGIRVITVDRPEPEVKTLALKFADTYGIPHVPALEWRFAASAVRAMHIAEKLLVSGTQVDWLAQAICAGFGPVGVYECWSDLVDDGMLDPGSVPPFLGVQQASNAPIVRAWQARAPEITGAHTQSVNIEAYIEPGMYNTNPNNNYANLLGLVDRYGGNFLAVNMEEFRTCEETIRGWFRDAGLEFTINPQTGEILERAGILTGAGIIKAADRGLLNQGDRVLYLLTGGFRRLPSFEPLRPDLEVNSDHSIDQWVRKLGIILEI